MVWCARRAYSHSADHEMLNENYLLSSSELIFGIIRNTIGLKFSPALRSRPKSNTNSASSQVIEGWHLRPRTSIAILFKWRRGPHWQTLSIALVVPLIRRLFDKLAVIVSLSFHQRNAFINFAFYLTQNWSGELGTVRDAFLASPFRSASANIHWENRCRLNRVLTC